MRKAEFYQKIQDHFGLTGEQIEKFEKKFPDPLTKGPDGEWPRWNGHDVVDELGVPARGNRSFISDLIHSYTHGGLLQIDEEPQPMREINEMDLSEG